MTSTGTLISDLQADLIKTYAEKSLAERNVSLLLHALKLVAREVSPIYRPTSADSHLPQDIVRQVHGAIFIVTGEKYDE